MKMKYALLPALICGMIIAASPVLHAQDATTSGSSATASGGKGGGKGGAGYLAMLTKALSLTDDQQTKVKAILDDSHTKIQALDSSLSADDKKAKIKEIRDASHAAIKALLTPDQATKFDALPARGGGKGAGNGGN